MKSNPGLIFCYLSQFELEKRTFPFSHALTKEIYIQGYHLTKQFLLKLTRDLIKNIFNISQTTLPTIGLHAVSTS
jgi:hypothetical protein